MSEYVSKEERVYVQNGKLLQHLYYFCSMYVYCEQYAYFLYGQKPGWCNALKFIFYLENDLPFKWLMPGLARLNLSSAALTFT